MRQQRDLELDAEAPHRVRGHRGDLGDLLGGGIEIDMGVDQEYLAVRQHESGPIAPRPNTAVQLVMTATRLPRGVSGKR
jgi:hypothetical protein